MEANKLKVIEEKDPLAETLKKYGDKAITWGLAIVVVVFFAKFYFDAKVTNAKQAADNLSSLQETVKEIEVNSNPDKLKTLDDNIKTLADSSAPYNQIASAYQARSIAMKPDVKAKEDFIKNSNWKTVKGEEKLFAELAVFTVARSLLDGEKAQVGIDTISDLANTGSYMNVSALNALAKVAPEKFKAIKEEFKNKNPEQIDLVNTIK